MFTATGDDWASRAERLRLRTEMFIGGDWIPGNAEPITPRSPRDGRVLPSIAAASAEDVDRAVRNARETFAAGAWSGLAPRERGQRLIAFAQLIHDNAEELALTISLEMGKPVREALQVEMRAVVNCFRWYGEAADKLLDEMPVTAPGRTVNDRSSTALTFGYTLVRFDTTSWPFIVLPPGTQVWLTYGSGPAKIRTSSCRAR